MIGMVALGAVAVVVMGFVAINGMARAKHWRAGLELIARTHKLTLVQPEGAISAIYDLVHGETQGYSVRINIDDESSYGSDSTTRYMLMDLSGSSRKNLKIGAPGAFEQPGVTDFAKQGDARVLLADASFDAAVELRNVRPALLDALRNDETLRRRIMAFVADGLIVDDSHTTLRTRSFPKSGPLYLARFEQLMAMAQKLDELK